MTVGRRVSNQSCEIMHEVRAQFQGSMSDQVQETLNSWSLGGGGLI